MIWSPKEFEERYESLLSATDQYIFTSSYRVYNDAEIITEESPRLLDTIVDEEYLKTNEYALAKARCEDLLLSHDNHNWTIVRPAVTYDGSGRFQLAVLEANEWLWRAIRNIPVALPREILDSQATMSWGGDVATMIALLVGNQNTLGEIYTVSTSEHMTWREIASVYEEVVPLEISITPLQDFEQAHKGIYQIRYDRMFNRVIDNTKILEVTGLTQESLSRLHDKLPAELTSYLQKHKGDSSNSSPGIQGEYDKLVGGYPSLRYVMADGPLGVARYFKHRL